MCRLCRSAALVAGTQERARSPGHAAARTGGGEDVATGPLCGGGYASSHGRRRAADRRSDGRRASRAGPAISLPLTSVRISATVTAPTSRSTRPLAEPGQLAHPQATGAVTIQLPLPAVIRRGIDPHRPAGGPHSAEHAI